MFFQKKEFDYLEEAKKWHKQLCSLLGKTKNVEILVEKIKILEWLIDKVESKSK